MRVFPLALAVACAAPTAVALGDPVSTGIDLEHFVPGVGEGALLGIDGAGPPARRFSLVASLDHARGLLAVKNAFTQDTVSHPVRSLLAVDLAGDVSIGRRVSVGAGVPLAVGMTGDRLAGLGLGDEWALAAGVFGDLRLRLRVHVFGRPGIDVAALLVGTVPLGGQSQFFATSGPTLEPRLLLGWTTARGWLRFVLETGLRVMPERHLYDLVYSHYLHQGLGLDFHVARPSVERVHLLLELESGDSVTSNGTSWLEGRAGLRVRARTWLSVDVGVGGWAGAGPPGAPHPRLFTVVRIDT